MFVWQPTKLAGRMRSRPGPSPQRESGGWRVMFGDTVMGGAEGREDEVVVMVDERMNLGL